MDPITLRAIERIVAVLIGGLCIWLGQRLFLHIPEQKGGEGKLQFPGGISIYVTHVGPGVFFALFGAVIVGLSFYRGVELQSTRIVPAAEAPIKAASAAPGTTVERFQYRGAGGAMGTDEAAMRADARVAWRREFAAFNTLPGALRPELPPHERIHLLRSIADSKLKLMESMWDDSPGGWGDRAGFSSWVKGGEQGSPPPGLEAALKYYRYGAPVTR